VGIFLPLVCGFIITFRSNRRSGRRFEGLCGLFALLSVLVIFIESGLGTQYHLT
jgi:voltage-gated potassium channel